MLDVTAHCGKGYTCYQPSELLRAGLVPWECASDARMHNKGLDFNKTGQSFVSSLRAMNTRNAVRDSDTFPYITITMRLSAYGVSHTGTLSFQRIRHVFSTEMSY